MVRDIELPFNYHTKMNCCQMKFLLYLLTKQNGDFKPKWWPDNIHFEKPISNLLDISKDSLIDVFKSYYKFKGDSKWLRAVLHFTANLNNLTNEIDYSSIDISGKISHNGVEFEILPSLENKIPIVKLQPVSFIVDKNKKYSILNQSTVNVSPAVVAHFNGTKLKDNNTFGTNINYTIDLTNDEIVETDNKDIKICIKESHIKQLMPTASVQLYDVVKYKEVHSKEDFLLTLNLMKTEVLSKLNLLKFRKRLRNTSRDTIRSASQFEKDLIKFRSKPNKEIHKYQSKQKENNKKPQIKVKEKDKVKSENTSTTEHMVVDNLQLPLLCDEIIDVDGEIDINKENENSFKENITTPVILISSPKTSTPLQPKSNKIMKNTDSVVIDLTVENTPTKTVQKATNNLYHFLNISPKITPKSEMKITQSPPKPEKKLKQSSPPKNFKRLNRHSMPLMNQKDIKSYFSPIPMNLTPEFIVSKIEKLKKVCRPCFVRLDFVKDLKPIRSVTIESVDDIETNMETLPLPVILEEVAASVIDLTNDETNKTDCNEAISEKENDDLKLNKIEKKDKVINKPKNVIKLKNDTIKKKKVIIKVKWPSKRITL